MSSYDHQRLLSEIHFNRALIWMLSGYVAGPEYWPLMAVCIIGMVFNIWKSYVEWPDEE